MSSSSRTAIGGEGHRRRDALLDWGYPLWYRLTVDLDSDWVVEAVLTTPGNRIEDRYLDFDAPLRIDPPIGG